MKHQTFFKEPEYRSEPYRTFVESLDCCIDNNECDGDIAAHHTKSGKPKGSDLLCIPLCYFHHVCVWHTQGPVTFENRYSVIIDKLVNEVNHAYIKELESMIKALKRSKAGR